MFGIFVGGYITYQNHHALNQLIFPMPQIERNTPRSFSLSDFYRNDIELQERVEAIYQSMSPKQRIAQLLMPTFERFSDIERIRAAIQNEIAGGIMILDSNYLPSFTAELQSLNRLYSPAGLLIAIDAEPSLLPYRIPELSEIPPTALQSTPEEVTQFAQNLIPALEERGVNINFAPVYDNNQNTAVIGNRSFGKNATEILPLTKAFNAIMTQANIATTAKHFPGHGKVNGDSHISLVTIEGALTELEAFRGAIAQEVPVMMIGHIAVTDNPDYDTNGKPASLSRRIVTDLLKTELGFNGVVITDGMNMGALNSFKNPEVEALKAGADIILIPADENQIIYEVLTEINENPSFLYQIEQSVKKVIRLKTCLGQA